MTHKKKALVVIPFAFHRESGSSLSTYYRVLALSELLERVDIITTPHGSDISLPNVTIIRLPKIKFFKSYQPGEYKKRLIYEFFLFIGTFKLLLRNNYNLVIVHGSSIYWAFWLQKLFKVTFIATVHGNIQVELEKWGISSKKFLKKIAAKIENKIIGNFPNIIAEHESVKTILIKGGVDPEKISLIKICVKSVNKIELSKNDNLLTILYTGTFVKIQNIDLLYRTAILLRNENIVFIIVGGIEDELPLELKKVKSFSLEDKIKILPRMNQKDLMNYYWLSDIVVSPREFGHDTPMKIFDYLNFGKCILATDRPIHTGILNSEVACLVEPTPEAFAFKILELKTNPILIREKELAAKQFFEDNFNLDVMINNYRKFLTSIN